MSNPSEFGQRAGFWGSNDRATQTHVRHFLRQQLRPSTALSASRFVRVKKEACRC
jgi:hypothetical protein